jgi:hypothetical protein
MKTLKTLFAMIPVAALMACNTSDDASNPLRDYKGLKQAPITDVKSANQTVVTPDVFKIEVVRQGQDKLWQTENIGNFIEGQPGQVMIRVTPKDAKITRFSLRIADFPLAQSPTLAGPYQGNIYALQWNAPVGTIPNGLFGMVLDLQLQARVEDSSERLLVGVADLQTLPLILNRNNLQPQFMSRTDLKAGLDEGQEIDFVVEVNDPGTSSSSRFPEISITPYIYSNTEAYRADGSSYVRLDETKTFNPERVAGTTRWKFHYKILVVNLPLDRDRRGKEIPSVSEVDMCFQMRAISVLGTQSADQQQVCTKARYAAQPPVFSDLMKDFSEVKAGSEVTWTFKIAAPHALSIVSLPNDSRQVSALGGANSVSCSDESAERKNVKVCTVKWKPVCVRSPLKRSLTLKADSTLGTKVKSSTFTKEFTIQPDPQACPGVRP